MRFLPRPLKVSDMPPFGVRKNVFTREGHVGRERQQTLAVDVSFIADVGAKDLVGFIPWPSLSSPSRACVSVHEHKQLFMCGHPRYNFVQGCPESMLFLTALSLRRNKTYDKDHSSRTTTQFERHLTNGR